MKSNSKLVQKNIKELIPYARNSRTHSDAQVASIAASIQEFGFTNPVLIGDDNVLIAGHGRLLAAQKLKINTVPCVIISGLTENQRKALVLADNRLALDAGWDNEMLKLELEELQEADYALELTGFSEEEIAKLLNPEEVTGLTEPDETPELQEVVVTQLGDIWCLGNHRLRCGSSTVATDVESLLDGVSPHLMVTDPPYGVEYDPTWRDNAGGTFGDGKTKMRGKVDNDHTADWSEAYALFPGHIAYVWHSALHASEVAKNLTDLDFKLRAQIIWVKPHFIMSRGDYHWQHEPCWYAVKGTGKWAGDRKQTTVWEIAGMNPAGRSQNKADVKSSHGTQKPVECMQRPIENNSSPGQAVYEPFSGSGTTIIGAEITSRICYAMEISPQYCDMAVRRWQNFTGKQAILSGRELTFEQVESNGRKNQIDKDIDKTGKAKGKAAVRRRRTTPSKD